jgi:hypothetical protein
VSDESSIDHEARPEWTADELLVLTRAMAGIFLDRDAPLRIGILRKLTKAERALNVRMTTRPKEQHV